MPLIQDQGDYEVILPEEPYTWGTSHITPKIVPDHIKRPAYNWETDPGTNENVFRERFGLILPILKGSSDDKLLRESARLARRVLNYAGTLVKTGITTEVIDDAVHEFIISHGAYPSPLGYNGFPKSCCTSINNIVTHGIPDRQVNWPIILHIGLTIRPLKDGDIINIDVTVYLNGFHGDTSKTFLVGDVDKIGKDLVDVTNLALQAGIDACGPGRHFRGISKAIHEVIRGKDFSICGQYTGHGIGRGFHHKPWIFHDLNEEPGVMQPGQCFTIEPCVVVGTDPQAWTFPDGWTSSTESAARSAQAEHMILITESGFDVLTKDLENDVD
ncbi:methionyl aminopeptidase [Abortiporus biennis]|nr:methionyl aminopeptidase [Abortiporus biennis]